MASVQRQYVYGEKNKKVIAARILTKGQDGATWYTGSPDTVTLCKKGDLCFDSVTFDIYKCIIGGNSNTAVWEWVCNLNNLNQITEFINTYKDKIEDILKDLDNQAGAIKQDVKIMLDMLTNSQAYKPWWFGTREEYNSMTEAERNKYKLHFVEEGS